MVIFQAENSKVGVQIPSTELEFTPEYIQEITKHIRLNKYQALVAMVMKTRVFDFCVGIRNPKKDQNVGVTTFIANYPQSEKQDDKIISFVEVGDYAVIDRSSLERGIHVSVPTIATPANLSRYLDEDKEFMTAIVTGKKPEVGNKTICLIQFKIVPINSIVAVYPRGVKVNDTLVEKNLNNAISTGE